MNFKVLLEDFATLLKTVPDATFGSFKISNTRYFLTNFKNTSEIGVKQISKCFKIALQKSDTLSREPFCIYLAKC